ncbi:hypothetical protein BB560_004497, partial [Smittium megazygosporum]
DSDLEFLIELYVENYESHPYTVLDELINFSILSFTENDVSSEHFFASLTDKTLPVFFKSIACGLSRQFVKLGKQTSSVIIEEMLPLSKALHSLMIEARNLSKYKNVLVFSLRQGLVIIDTVTKRIIPTLEPIFLIYKDDILKALFHLQKSTRTMQIICGHSKAVRDLKMSKLVPTVRRSLESIVLRVKELLKNNNCISAFEIGSLRHRVNMFALQTQIAKRGLSKTQILRASSGLVN